MRTTDLDRGQKIVSGRVSSDGTVLTGTADFVVRKTATGDYTIIVPGVRLVKSATVTMSSGNANIANGLTSTGPNTFRVYLQNTAGTAVDQTFTFSADVLP